MHKRKTLLEEILTGPEDLPGAELERSRTVSGPRAHHRRRQVTDSRRPRRAFAAAWRERSPHLPDPMTPDEICDVLRVGRKAVYTWLRSGRLRGMKAGHGWRVARAALEAFLNPPPRTSRRTAKR